MKIDALHFQKFVVSLLLGCVIQTVQAGQASPFPVQLEQNGFITGDLYFHGNSPYQSFITDAAGYTVIEDEETSHYMYAVRNITNGELVSSGIAVGQGDPAEAGIPKGLLPSTFSNHSQRLLSDQVLYESPAHYRRLGVPSILKNLVVLVRFSDHRGRSLPTRSDFTILFNRGGSPHKTIAPTGSIKDFFRANSYGKFTLESTVFGWIDLPRNENYYANGISGFGSSRYFEALHFAMNSLRDKDGIDFSRYDADKDGKVDVVTMIHSGYAAEILGNDQYGTSVKNRIWSHYWRLSAANIWYSGRARGSVAVDQYCTAPALFGLSGSNIGRIGVIAHEIFHSIGLPDLYGTPNGNGIGSYDLMANHWGFAPVYSLSQLYPPMLSPYCKMLVGWLDPMLITTSETFTIEPSSLSQQIYRIDMNQEKTEYMLIENRQPVGWDLFLPQGGLAIWHIDENAKDVEGYPGQPGAWPFNGKHYKVALLQADGRYDLERRNNQGDELDLFHGNGKSSLGQSFDLLEGPFPNTDSYSAVPRQTGIRIRDISESSSAMKFTVDFLEKLSTPFLGGNGAVGNMFDIYSKRDVVVRLLYLHLNKVGPVAVEVWTRTGTHVSFEKKPWLWQRRAIVSVEGRGRGKKTALDLGGIQLNARTRYAFYIVVLDGKLRYTNGNRVGKEVSWNADLIVYEGVGLSAPFHNIFSPRIWNGEILYNVISKRNGQRRLDTKFDGQVGTESFKNGQDGVMFDVMPYANVNITGFDLVILNVTKLRIYAKDKSVVCSNLHCSDWTLIEEIEIDIGQKGHNETTYVGISKASSVAVKMHKVETFYISIVNDMGGLHCSRRQEPGSVLAKNSHFAILQSITDTTAQIGSFSGTVHYVLDN